MGNIWTCASASRTDVNYYAGDGAGSSLVADGDIVKIPDGNPSYTSPVNITKGITVRAITIPTLDSNGYPIACGVNIKDDVDRGISFGETFNINVAEGKTVIIKFIGFVPGALTTPAEGAIAIQGTCKDVRIHHNILGDTFHFRFVHVYGGYTEGLVHSNFIDSHTNGAQSMAVKQPNWGGGVNDSGDGSWAAPSDMGSLHAWFLENNNISGHNRSATDGESGSRMVARFNTVLNDFFSVHGTESSLRQRSPRWLQAYCNSMNEVATDTGQIAQYRGGTGFVFLNFTTGYLTGAKGLDFNSYLSFTPFGATGNIAAWSDGTRPYDVNVGGVFLSGTHTGGSVLDILTDSGANFTAYAPTNTPLVPPGAGYTGNEYSILNTTKGWSSFITATTTTTVSAKIATDDRPTLTHPWDFGDHYEIRKCYPVLDQAGRGQGDLLFGGDNITHPTPVAWPNQAPEPILSFLNSLSNPDGVYPATSQFIHTQVGRDILIDFSVWGASPAVRNGTKAAMITTTGGTGDFWWVTDEGSWNSGANPIYTSQGQLYKWNGSSWSLYFTPPVYPHPLASLMDGEDIPPASNIILMGEGLT